jgi:hypothetical protein
MRPQPRGQRRDFPLPGGDLEHGEGGVRLTGGEAQTVLLQEKPGGEKRGTLVAVDEGMVGRDRQGVGAASATTSDRPSYKTSL